MVTSVRAKETHEQIAELAVILAHRDLRVVWQLTSYICWGICIRERLARGSNQPIDSA